MNMYSKKFLKLLIICAIPFTLVACTNNFSDKVPVTDITTPSSPTKPLTTQNNIPITELTPNNQLTNQANTTTTDSSVTHNHTNSNANTDALLAVNLPSANRNPFPIFTKIFGYRVTGKTIPHISSKVFSNKIGIYDSQLTTPILAAALITRTNATESYKTDHLIKIGNSIISDGFRKNTFVFNNNNEQQLVELITYADTKTDKVRILQFSAPNIFIAKNVNRSHFVTTAVLSYPVAQRQSLYQTLIHNIYQMQTKQYNLKTCRSLANGSKLCNIKINNYNFNLLQATTTFTIQAILPTRK